MDNKDNKEENVTTQQQALMKGESKKMDKCWNRKSSQIESFVDKNYGKVFRNNEEDREANSHF